MPLRVSRVSAGMAEKASTIPGMTKCCQVPVPEIGSQPQLQAEDDHQDQPEPEARHRLADHGDELHQPIHPGVLPDRGQDAERDGDDQRDGEAGQPQRQGDRHALA